MDWTRDRRRVFVAGAVAALLLAALVLFVEQSGTQAIAAAGGGAFPRDAPSDKSSVDPTKRYELKYASWDLKEAPARSALRPPAAKPRGGRKVPDNGLEVGVAGR